MKFFIKKIRGIAIFALLLPINAFCASSYIPIGAVGGFSWVLDAENNKMVVCHYQSMACYHLSIPVKPNTTYVPVGGSEGWAWVMDSSNTDMIACHYQSKACYRIPIKK